MFKRNKENQKWTKYFVGQNFSSDKSDEIFRKFAVAWNDQLIDIIVYVSSIKEFFRKKLPQ